MVGKADNIALTEVVYSPSDEKNAQPKLLLPEIEQKPPTSCTFLYFAAAIASLSAFMVGVAFSWTSPVIPKLDGSVEPTANPFEVPITPAEASWIAGLLSLGSAVGPLVAGTTADKIGRKRILLVLAIPITVSFLMTAYCNTPQLFYIARLVLGFACGSVFAVLPNYIGEIAQDHNRGTLGCLIGVSCTVGLLFSFVIGPLFNVRTFSLICLSPLVIFVPIFSLIIPESPVFLVSIGDVVGARNSLRKLRGKTDVQMDLTEITKTVHESRQGGSGVSEFLRSKGLRKGLTVSLGLIIFQQLSGMNAVFSFMQSIFNATGSGMSPSTSTIIIGSVQVATVVLTSAIVDLLGRRILLLVSATCSGIALIALGAYFHLQTNGDDVSSLFWLPVGSLIAFIISLNIGLGPLPWAIMGELFPPNVKSMASTITSSVCFGMSFLITLFFPHLSAIIGMAQSFWLFGLCCLLGTIFFYYIVPETKGKTLLEIQRILEGRIK